MKHYILFNPLAGHGDPTGQPWVTVLQSGGDEVILRQITDYPDKEAYEVFFASLEDSDCIYLCGGDGTINRFANATEGLDIRHTIYYFAGGTGNDFLHDLDGQSADEPFPINEYLKNLPAVEVNGERHLFLDNVGFGIDGYCCEVGDAQRAARAGQKDPKPVNYTAIAIKGLLFHYKPCGATVTVDGVEHRYERVWLAPTMKGRYYGGGMMPTPAQDRRDPEGKLSVMVMYGSGKLKTLTVFPSIFKGEHIGHPEMVDILEGRDIRVAFDRPTALQIDGETILNVTAYHAKA